MIWKTNLFYQLILKKKFINKKYFNLYLFYYLILEIIYINYI